MLLLLALLLPAQPDRPPVLLDTDLGSGIDDVFALALVLASPEIDLRGVTGVGGDTAKRALLLSRFLTMTGRRSIPIAAGADPQPPRDLGARHQYYYHPDVLFNRTTRPVKESAVEFLHARLKAQPGKVTLVALGPLTNVARLLSEKPESRPRRIVFNGANAAYDVKATRAVLASGVPLIVVPAGFAEKLSAADVRRVLAPGTALSLNVRALYQLADAEDVPLGDVLAAALAIDERLATLEPQRLEVDDKGVLRRVKGDSNASVATVKDGFAKWYVARMAACVAPATRPAEPVARGGMPHRVHVAEDFETDIERRWWMAGRPETREVPAGSKRAVRGVLTHDFDDLLGNPKAMHTAVVFNPVPGPPMGKNTRLSFRYRLDGTDTLRVQIYSLTNGYHRHLVLKGLPQGRWQEATVDMTAARRPDGTGGPLSEGERIDDVQFYADPSAELWIDDLVLFDAAAKGEARPFPKRVHFTGTFDSGKQGKEWPGDFEILANKGAFWHAAASVPNKGLGVPWVRIDLRGTRPVGKGTRVAFRYRLTGADRMTVELRNRAKGDTWPVNLMGLKKDIWAEATADCRVGGPADVDEVSFTLPKGGAVLLDDVLVYEPG